MRNALGRACMEPLLHAASAVRAWSPACAEDIEFVENLFDVVASMLATPDNQARFDDLEGSALLLIIIKFALFLTFDCFSLSSTSFQKQSKEPCAKGSTAGT